MEGSRGLLSRMSTSSTGSEAVQTPSCDNCMELIHGLYKKLEPQMSKSYRPNVTYVPTPEERPKKPNQMKTAQIVISAVAEMKRLQEANVTITRRRDSTNV